MEAIIFCLNMILRYVVPAICGGVILGLLAYIIASLILGDHPPRERTVGVQAAAVGLVSAIVTGTAWYLWVRSTLRQPSSDPQTIAPAALFSLVIGLYLIPMAGLSAGMTYAKSMHKRIRSAAQSTTERRVQ